MVMMMIQVDPVVPVHVSCPAVGSTGSTPSEKVNDFVEKVDPGALNARPVVQ